MKTTAIGSIWKCEEEGSEYYGMFCEILSINDEPEANGTDSIEVIYNNGDIYEGKVHRFLVSHVPIKLKGRDKHGHN